MPEPTFEFSNFYGINNLADYIKIAESKKVYLRKALNVDIDDEGMIKRRLGQELKLSGDIHSMWANKAGDIALYVRDGVLRQLSTSYIGTPLLAGLNLTARMVYTEDPAGNIYFTNNDQIGQVVGGVASLFSDPLQTFKVKMKAGHLIEWYNNRLYVAKGRVIYCSDAGAPAYMDKRKGFTQLASHITMMKAVHDGMWVSTVKETGFLAGKDPSDFSYMKITDSGAYEGSPIKIDGEDIGQAVLDTVILWTSIEGVFMGMPEGQVKNLTWEVYQPTHESFRACGVYRSDRGFGQYLAIYELQPGIGAIDGEARFPLMAGSGYMAEG